ncbi:LamG-like jellyroll fold domain-containing protein [Ruania zhangjianzhongii]|uniref:LamG-like jellyroll fold domain-containing protein n=1 Tax=Ruania zhangjianzhongii TaxID=2603206 RepID=UPI0011C9C425|nr:LamG-like jellyroll fold domain-containing protein [Ruania zhangjianzhongii]
MVHSRRTSPLPASALRRTLTTALAGVLALGLWSASASAEPGPGQAAPPEPDLLDVDLTGEPFQDAAMGREPTVVGTEPPIAPGPALGHPVATFDGTNAVRYYVPGIYDTTEFTVECTIRVGGPESEVDNRNNFCGSKEGGGFSLNAGEQVKVLLNVDGTYYTVETDIAHGVWYHVAGVWDGAALALYINGELVDEVAAEGDQIRTPSAEYFYLAADTDPAGDPEFIATGQLAQAALYSSALSAEEVAARYAEVFAEQTDQEPSFELISPAPESRLRAPTTLAADVQNADLLAGDLSLSLDGEQITPGDEIGPGLSRGEHTLAYRGMDRLGRAIAGDVTFTAAAIPTGDGATQSSGDGTAQLTARATHPTGGALRTTFLAGDLSAAEQAESGSIRAAAFDRETGVAGDVELQEASAVDDPLLPADGEEFDSPASAEIPALQADVPFTAAGQSVVWRGNVDPAREVHLLLLSTETGRYEVADSARGSADRQIQLSTSASEENDVDGVVRTLVVGVDPFADDLDNPVEDGFEDPDGVDFSLMHITDTQYMVGAATNPDKPPAEQDEWLAGYQDSYRWLAEHGEEHQVEFVAHTGDLVDSWANDSDRDRAIAQFELALQSQEMLEETGIPNAVLPGNHDNLNGQESGSDSLYNSYFGPERYEQLAQSEGWRQRDAEYHPWQPGDNDNGYVLFSAGGEDFVVVTLGYQVTEEEGDWASAVFEEYSARNGIVMTHAAHKTSSQPNGRDGVRTADGELISERVMEESPNVMLLLAGHVTGVTINVRQDVGQNGNNVVELTHDYQGYRIGTDHLGLTDIGNYDGDTPVTFGATFFRLLQFDLDRGELSVDTYSAYLDEFGATDYDTDERYNGEEDDFRVPIQTQGRTTAFTTDALVGLTPTEAIIGAVTHDSGEDATVTWEDLEDGVPYGWFAVTRDVVETDDVDGLRTLALTGTADADLDEGIVQFGVFTGTGEAQGSEPAPTEPAPERPAPDEPDPMSPDPGQAPAPGGSAPGGVPAVDEPVPGEGPAPAAAGAPSSELASTGAEQLPLLIAVLMLVLTGVMIRRRVRA